MHVVQQEILRLEVIDWKEITRTEKIKGHLRRRLLLLLQS